MYIGHSSVHKTYTNSLKKNHKRNTHIPTCQIFPHPLAGGAQRPLLRDVPSHLPLLLSGHALTHGQTLFPEFRSICF